MPPKKTKKKLAKEHDLDEAEVQEIREAFDVIAQDGMTIPVSAVPSAMAALGIDSSSEDKRSITAHLNHISKDGVDFEAFLGVVALKMQHRDKDETVETAFNLFDVQGTGQITVHDLRRIAKELNEDVKESDLLDMMNEAGNADGINKMQFEKVMERAGVW